MTEGSVNNRTQLQAFTPERIYHPEEFTPYIGKKKVEELQRIAAPLEGAGWTNVNSTLIGGGVAEILRSAIPLALGLGLDARWHVIQGNDAFFQVTKKFHNMLQGMDLDISLEEIFDAYLGTIDQNAQNTFIASDLVVIHDPQPAAMVMNGFIFGNVLWRCHIDTSEPNRTVWRFLLPYINHCAGAIFTTPQFVGPGLQIPLYQITPSINPLTDKNHQFSHSEALDVLGPLFNEHDIDPERPIVAAISRYDIHKNQETVLRAFQNYREQSGPDPAPYLIFLGNTATDDPEGGEMLAHLQELADGDPDVRFWVNVPDNDRVVGALNKIAAAFVHVSTREGFGLVVSEAMWQGTPVIGSRTGGIINQIKPGETGFLVDPLDVPAISRHLSTLLDDPNQAHQMGERAREHVREHFLLPELVRRYLILIKYYTGRSLEPPQFRLNDLSYSEVICIMRPHHPDLSH